MALCTLLILPQKTAETGIAKARSSIVILVQLTPRNLRLLFLEPRKTGS